MFSITNNFHLHYKEEKVISKYIETMQIDKNNFSTMSEYFSAISDYVNTDFNTERNTWKSINLKQRPFLRQSVKELLNIKEGVCGEGTRVIIKILHSLGYDATRLAFYSKRFGAAHALVSVDINGTEILVDSINFNKELHEIFKTSESNMKMIDIIYYGQRFFKENKNIQTNFSKYFKQNFSTYSYEAIPYSKLISKLGGNKHIFNYDRPNKYLSYLAESVYLIKAIVFSFILFIWSGIYFILSRRIIRRYKCVE